MKLLRITALSGVATLIKIVTSLITLKIVASYTGPKGVAILGQFMSLVNIMTVLAGGGINLGIIKFVAEYRDCIRLKEFLSSALGYALCFSILTLLVGVYFSQRISNCILGSENYSYTIWWLSIVQLFIAFYLFLSAVINGFERILLLTQINIVYSLFGLISISIMAVCFNLKGILIGVILSQGMGFFIIYPLTYREKWFKYLFSFKINTKYWYSLANYSIMNIVSILTVPVAQIIVRKELNSLFGWEAVGYWQAIVRISDSYLLFVTTALTTYYLPRLAQLSKNNELKNEIYLSYKLLMPIVFLTLALIYLFRGFIIRVLYTENFEPATELFFFQLLGDFFRIGGWLFTYLLLAKSLTKTYILTEILLSIFFVMISHSLCRYYGLIGVTYAFSITYLFYWLMMFTITRSFFNRQKILIVNEQHNV